MTFKLNSRGASLLGATIAAGVGLVVALGISKSLINFSEQTAQTDRKRIISEAHSSLMRVLKDGSVWRESVTAIQSSSNCKYPGQSKKCPLKLVRRGTQITCGTGNRKAVGFYSTAGTMVGLTDADCKKCGKNQYCGRANTQELIRFEVSFPPNTASETQTPDFSGQIQDFSVSKSVKGIETVGQNGILIDPARFNCPTGQYIAGVQGDGSPICKNINQPGQCPGNQFLKGYQANGQPICVAPPAPPAPATPTITLTKPCSGGQYLYNIVDNKPQCRTDLKGSGSTTTIISQPSGPSCYGSGTLPRGSYLHTSGGSASNWGGCKNQGLACGKSNGNSAKCCSGTAQWMYPNGCGSPPQCLCN